MEPSRCNSHDRSAASIARLGRGANEPLYVLSTLAVASAAVLCFTEQEVANVGQMEPWLPGGRRAVLLNASASGKRVQRGEGGELN